MLTINKLNGALVMLSRSGQPGKLTKRQQSALIPPVWHWHPRSDSEVEYAYYFNV